MIDAEALSRMKATAVLVNTCRGDVIDETALAVALSSNGIAFAGLDVLSQEPPNADNPLLGLPNVLLTPHTAGITRDTWTRRGKFVYENIDRVIQGRGPTLSCRWFVMVRDRSETLQSLSVRLLCDLRTSFLVVIH